MASVPGVTPEDMAVLERYGYKPNSLYMEVPRCDGCRWWRRLDGSVGRCGMPGSVRANGLPSMLVVVDQAGGWRLITAPGFGCVEWQEKESE